MHRLLVGEISSVDRTRFNEVSIDTYEVQTWADCSGSVWYAARAIAYAVLVWRESEVLIGPFYCYGSPNEAAVIGVSAANSDSISRNFKIQPSRIEMA